MNKRLSGPWPRFSLSLSVALILACTVAGLAAQKKNDAAPGASVFAQDKGKLTIKLDGQTVGHEEFEISPSAGGWLAKGNADIKPSQSACQQGLRLAHASARWRSRQLRMDLASGNNQQRERPLRKWHRKNDAANAGCSSLRSDLHVRNSHHRRPRQQSLSPVRRFSPRLRLVQTRPANFPVFIPQELMPGTITAESTGSATLDGKSYEGFRVTTPISKSTSLDANHRMMRLEVPAAKVSVIREVNLAR